MYVIIPARYGSTRLPGKPLLDVAGKPLIQRAYECAQGSGAREVVIATDDARVRAAAESFGASVCMTSGAHQSGTDRIAEAVRILQLGPDDIVVNLQGDEPLMPGGLIRQTADALASRTGTAVATACCPIRSTEEFRDPSVVKVVMDVNGYAMYFSRAPIPWPRGEDIFSADMALPTIAFRHIGIYAYRAGFIGRFAAWLPCPLEETERLEQLRVLWHGERILVCESASPPPAGIDTAEDLERVRKLFSGSATPAP